MPTNVSFAEIIAGLLLLIITVAIVVAMIFYPTQLIPTTLWAFYTSIAGYLFGVQVPSGGQRVLMERQMATLEALALRQPVVTNISGTAPAH
jgi:hypothetical protein